MSPWIGVGQYEYMARIVTQARVGGRMAGLFYTYTQRAATRAILSAPPPVSFSYLDNQNRHAHAQRLVEG